jgi:hypothetical protein
MAWRKAVLAAGTILFVSASMSWAGFSPYGDDQNSYDPYDYQADSQDPHWLMDEQSGCWAYDSNAGPKNSITWSGDCRNGRADGEGTLTFFERRREIERLTGTFADGMLQDGHVQIAWSDGSSYDGDEVHGQFNGTGVLIASDGSRYDGQWRDDNFVGPANRNPDVAGDDNARPGGDTPEVADNAKQNNSTDEQDDERTRVDQAAQTKTPEPEHAQPVVHWPFLDGAQSKLSAVDGSELSFSVESGGMLKRTIVHADGSTADTTLTPDSDNTGTVRNQRGVVVATYQLANDALDITYRNGRTESIAANGAGGLTVTTTPPGGLSIKNDWYPVDRTTTTAQNDVAPKPEVVTPAPVKLVVATPLPTKLAAATTAPSPKPAIAPPLPAPDANLPTPSPKPHLAALASHTPAHTMAAVHDIAPEETHAMVARDSEHEIHEETVVDSPIHPSVKPAATVSAEVAENLPQPEQKPALHTSKKHQKHGHVAVAEATPDQQPVAMHADVLPPPPEVHAVTVPDLHLRSTPPPVHSVAIATPPPPVRPAIATPPPPAPTHVAIASVTPPAPPAATPVHIAVAHAIGTQEPALRRSASDCLTVETNGTHWGFRNNCVTDIQFAYCVKNGVDRLTACGDSAVPGSVAAHGFTSLIADLSMKDPSASHAFRWVGCIGGAGEVVPRLDQSDPPMGRCLHTADLPSGVEHADNMKRNGKQ